MLPSTAIPIAAIFVSSVWAGIDMARCADGFEWVCGVPQGTVVPHLSHYDITLLPNQTWNGSIVISARRHPRDFLKRVDPTTPSPPLPPPSMTNTSPTIVTPGPSGSPISTVNTMSPPSVAPSYGQVTVTKTPPGFSGVTLPTETMVSPGPTTPPNNSPDSPGPTTPPGNTDLPVPTTPISDTNPSEPTTSTNNNGGLPRPSNSSRNTSLSRPTNSPRTTNLSLPTGTTGSNTNGSDTKCGMNIWKTAVVLFIWALA